MLETFETAGIEVSIGTAYRSFYAEKKRRDPDYKGVELQPGQDFVLMIGRAP